MPTPQETKKDVMSKVNGVVAALNLYPELNTTNTQLSFSPSANPIDLLVDFFKTTKGYDWLIDTVSHYISYGLPALELSVKGVLLANLRTILSCSVSPFITENMIKNGVVFNLNEIDLLNIFNYSPLNKNQDNPGKYYYFGCDPEDGINIIDDLKNSRDLNAVIWYAKNTPGDRVVWRKESDINKPVVLVNSIKQVKSNGIATIEFNGRSSGLKNSEGGAFYVQEPIDNCVHVFIGNCTELPQQNYDAEISECTRKIAQLEKLREDNERLTKIINDYRRNAKTQAIERGATAEELNKIDQDCNTDLKKLKKLDSAIIGVNGQTINEVFENTQSTDLNIELNTIHETINIPAELADTNEIREKDKKTNLLGHITPPQYPSATSNYYYRRLLFEWNTDFIMSMKLFDEKVVAAQLIDALTDCLRFNGIITLTPQMQFVQNQLKDLVTKIIETDEGVVSDCFFSFTNDKYNDLLNEVEINRANLSALNNETTNAIPYTEDVMTSLNTLSHDATKEELQSAISGSIFAATSASAPNEYDKTGNLTVDINANMSIIDQLLTKLVYVIVLTIMQPKIYILLMANLKLLGNDPNFDLVKFIQQFKDLISELIKSVRDNILEYFKNQLITVLQELVKTLAIRLTQEQYQYYITLLTHCINCLKIHRNQYDWLQDDVDYADITELNQTENQEC